MADRALPTGTVTFLFTDVEGSTRLLHELGDRYADALAEHRRVVRWAVARHAGVEVDTQGDAFFCAFARASDAVKAAAEAQDGLTVPVRMGIHAGEQQVTGEGFVGLDVHCAARICAAGHGGQVLLSQATRALLDSSNTVLLDLGSHRLRDVGEVRLHQLGEGAFPPLRSLSQTNLPLPATPLVGRKKELADVLRLLRDGARLVTLTGPGGIGKTRFALEVAAELIEHFPDGVWFVDLSPLRDPALVLPTVASRLGAQGELADHVRERELLLVLDNFEQVVESAGDVADLLVACPGLVVLVTSREPLHVGGEHEYPLAPLAESPAVELFRQRAEAARPESEAEYRVAAEICGRLDSLPLAIELAAARVRTLTAEELLARLEQRLPLLTSRRRDAPERQRTLRATIEWSYDLLSPDEQRLFRRLCVSAGGFTLESAERVCDADLDTLESLVEKSLLRPDGPRFTMLETVRELATEHLAASAEAAAVRDRHADHFRRLAQHTDEEIEAAEQFTEEHPDEEWFDRLAADEDNLRAALRTLLDEGRCDEAMKMCFAMHAFWLCRDRGPEGVRWASEALQCSGETSSLARGLGLYAHSVLAFFTSDFEGAERSTEEYVALARDHRDDYALAAGYSGLGALARSRGDLGAAREHIQKALELDRKSGDRNSVQNSLHQLGEVARDDGEFDDAERLLADAATEAGAAPPALANTIHSLGDLAVDRRRWDEAAARYLESLAIFEELGRKSGLAYCLAGLASVAAARADAVRAGRLWGATVEIEESVATPLLPFERVRYQRALEAVRGPAFEAAVEEGSALLLDEALALARAESDA